MLIQRSQTKHDKGYKRDKDAQVKRRNIDNQNQRQDTNRHCLPVNARVDSSDAQYLLTLL